MRVIAGQYRGRKLEAPPGLNTRPILDRVKVSLFDWLGARLARPGILPPISVLDLFCGGGSLGIEALSRGAQYCVFVETNPEALKCLRDNLRKLHIRDAARIEERPAQALKLRMPEGEGFDLVFVDPPYAMSHDVGSGSVMERIMQRLGDDVPVKPDGLLLWRHEREIRLPESFGQRWRMTDRKDWGTMSVTVYE